jgi:hypothetical protein
VTNGPLNSDGNGETDLSNESDPGKNLSVFIGTFFEDFLLSKKKHTIFVEPRFSGRR